ncbi:Chromosome-partitioning protein Spo0J [Rhodoplanes serenus]|uniref:Chromosome-partitioning protein Spo0J n=1 Tax=Rhodoplanes serenus TaxID=200615 RepID=A0A3S4B1Y8_9BRAD|nr:MT-A70 family methyltransferase [Rhodoplanes serenus]VCU09645.1 Chromosome-partitioning protein Spo0J [Rhodoplanes serenus]
MPEIDLHLCYPSLAARPVDSASVDVLAASIAENGLMQPITVRPAKRSRAGQTCDAYEVIAGMHRVKAFRKLGRTTIPAVVVEVDDLRAELMLIDENLARNDLSAAERASYNTRRKAIWQELHPETKRHAAGNGRTKAELVAQVEQPTSEPAARYDEVAASATGQASSTIRRDCTRGEALGGAALAKVARTSLDKGEELDALAKLRKTDAARAAELIDRAAAGEKVSAKIELKKAARAAREADLGARQCALPQRRYGVILADPEWRFAVRSRETGLDRAADNHYPTSSTDEIAARDVGAIAADDCALFLWATVPMLPDALRVMAAWGFRYVSHFVWAKDRVGTGYWNRNRHELLLVGTRGAPPAPAPGTQWDSLIEAPVGAHSAKPEQFLALVEAYYPSLAKIELNRRGPPRPGWDAWGNEAEPPAQDADIDTGEIAGTETAYPAGADDQSAGSPTVESSHEVSQSDVSRMPREGPAVSQRSARHAEPEDDGLDIPAFLRRPAPSETTET